MADGGDGLSSAVAQAIEERGALLPLADAEQLELLRDGDGRLSPANMLGQRRAGRPRGSVNKRTAKVRDYLLARYVHPLEALAQLYSRPVDALACELACSRLEAMQLQIKAAAEVAPYVEGKMPVSIDVAGKVDAVLLMPGINAPDIGLDELAERITTDGLEGLPIVEAEYQEFQGDSE